jgi:hypothetical protein
MKFILLFISLTWIATSIGSFEWLLATDRERIKKELYDFWLASYYLRIVLVFAWVILLTPWIFPYYGISFGILFFAIFSIS